MLDCRVLHHLLVESRQAQSRLQRPLTVLHDLVGEVYTGCSSISKAQMNPLISFQHLLVHTRACIARNASFSDVSERGSVCANIIGSELLRISAVCVQVA